MEFAATSFEFDHLSGSNLHDNNDHDDVPFVSVITFTEKCDPDAFDDDETVNKYNDLKVPSYEDCKIEPQQSNEQTKPQKCILMDNQFGLVLSIDKDITIDCQPKQQDNILRAVDWIPDMYHPNNALKSSSNATSRRAPNCIESDFPNCIESHHFDNAITMTSDTPQPLSQYIPIPFDFMGNFNGFIVWLLLFLMAIWQPLCCFANNQIALSRGGKPYNRVCAVWYGQASCWGYGGSQLGQGNTNDYRSPPEDPIRLNSDFIPIEISMGWWWNCALSIDGRVTCWGWNYYENLGLALGQTDKVGDTSSEMGDALPDVNLGTAFIVRQLVSGEWHSCALSDSSQIKCWGRNDDGQLGVGDTVNRGDDSREMGNNLDVVQLGNNFTPSKLVAGHSHNCVLSLENAIKCWGYNYNYQLGDGTNEDRGDDSDEMGDNLSPVDLGTGFIPIDIESGSSHVCALSESKAVKCWGSNYYGQLGISCGWTEQFGDALPALEFPVDFIPEFFDLGSTQSCFASTNGSMICFGDNRYGELGYGDTENRGRCIYSTINLRDQVAVDLGTDFHVAQIFAGYLLSCALSTNDELKCWGNNGNGQLGYNDQQTRGDEPGEMGNNLNAIDVPYTANPTTQPTPDPTIDPTKEPTVPTMSPTIDPTLEPTTQPTRDPTTDPTHIPTMEPTSPTTDPTLVPTNLPTTGPTADPSTVPTVYPSSDPTKQPTIAPTSVPTVEPTTTCDPQRNCTECLDMNSGGIQQCAWHSVHNQCYLVIGMDHIDDNATVDEADCISTQAAAASDSKNITTVQWVVLSLGIAFAVCVLALITAFLWRRRQLRDESILMHETEAGLEMNDVLSDDQKRSKHISPTTSDQIELPSTETAGEEAHVVGTENENGV